MVARNDITGDKIQTREGLSEQGEANFDRIFGKKKTNGGWKPPVATEPNDPLCKICGKSLGSTKECAWTSCPLNWGDEASEKRLDIIGQNGNNGYGAEE
jgi:hypothetical protein